MRNRSTKYSNRSLPFNKDDLVRVHAPQVLPPMIGIELHAERLTIPLRVSQRSWYEIRLRVHCPVVAKREWMVERYVLDRAPKIDYLESTLEQRLRIGGRQVPVNSGNGRGGCLIDMYVRDWLTLLWGVVKFSGTPTTNS